MVTSKKNIIAGLFDSFAFESITVADSAVSLTSATYTPSATTKAQSALITVESAQVRYRLDGSDPTASEGHILNINDVLTLTGSGDIASFKAIRTGSTSGVIKVTYRR